MSGKLFLDTNILVYAIESQGPNPEKFCQAQELVRRDDLTISTQVLGEFYTTVTHKRRPVPLSHNEATAWVQLWKRFTVTAVGVSHVDLAIHLVGRYKIGYFDAQILAAARLAGCDCVYSEDLQSGQDLDGVRVVNPFSC